MVAYPISVSVKIHFPTWKFIWDYGFTNHKQYWKVLLKGHISYQKDITKTGVTGSQRLSIHRLIDMQRFSLNLTFT